MSEGTLACELFENKYFNTISKRGEQVYKQYDEFLSNIFDKHSSTQKPTSQLDKIDFNKLISDEKNSKLSCSKCEEGSEKEFAEFLDEFSTQKTIPSVPAFSSKSPALFSKPTYKLATTTSSFEQNTENKLKKIYYPNDEKLCSTDDYSDRSVIKNNIPNTAKLFNRFDAQAEASRNAAVSSGFKTAHDELQSQNNAKFGASNHTNSYNGNSSSNNRGVLPKRRLGTNRRNVRGSFVSPLLSNNSSSNEDIKSDIKSEPVDERLKNIEPEMVELIKSEIMDCGPSIIWDDIAGLEFAKTAIQEAVVWPMLRPDIFTGLRRPPKGILLFGPPGTGKTLIGKCVASQSKSTFFSISASSLTSKWIGNGEKMVRALFSVARVHQPSVIFIDEIDSLLSQRSDTEHESSRRIKTEFLVQLDGATTDNEERILVIGATNRPQELDEAARRRLVKRLYIPLPDYKARLQLVQKLISKERHTLETSDYEYIAKQSEGYSGADIRNLCSEASLGPIRAIDMRFIEKIQATEVRPLIMSDFEVALTRVKSSVGLDDLEQYKIYDKTYGSGGAF